MRAALLPLLLVATLVAPASAQDRVSVPLTGFAMERYGEVVSRHVKSSLGLDYRTAHKYSVNTRVYASSEKNIDFKVRDNGSFKTVEVEISTAKLAELGQGKLPFTASQLKDLVQKTVADARTRSRNLVKELAPFLREASPNFVNGERLKLPGGIYPELAQAAEAYARGKLGKTPGEYLDLRTEVEMGQHEKLQLEPVRGKPGQYRLVVSQKSLAELSSKTHLRPDRSWLGNRFDARWQAQDPARNKPLPRQVHEPRYQPYVESSNRHAAFEKEVRTAFEDVRGRLMEASSDATFKERLRRAELNMTMFEEIGVRSKVVEFFPRGHVEADFGELIRKMKVDTIHFETFDMERLIEATPDKAARRAKLASMIEAVLAPELRAAVRATPLPPAKGESVERTLERLEPHRRADRTVRWGNAVKSGALRQVGGTAHFAMALFLKEVAVTVQTGDRARIEEFFDFLTTTDFFIHYGLFAAGAQVGDVLYSRFLARHVRPGFVSGILRTNIVLATGMALPELLSGHFNGRTFAIHLGSLGLSATAVKTGVEGIRWVTNLKNAERAGRLARASLAVRRLARVGGWLYTVGETAVVLYLGDELARAATHYLDEKAARADVGAATRRFVGRALHPQTDPRQLSEALEDLGKSHADYRNFLYQRLAENDQTYAARLGRAAREAKLLADRRAALLARLDRTPALKKRMIDQAGSVEAYLDAKQKDDEAALRSKLDEAMRVFEATRKEELAEIYGGNLREGDYGLDLSDPELLRWLAKGAPAGDPADPYAGRTGYFSNQNRKARVREFESAAGAISENRLQAYDDEVALLQGIRPHLTTQNRRVIDERIALLGKIRDQERELAGSVVELPGLTGALKKIGGKR